MTANDFIKSVINGDNPYFDLGDFNQDVLTDYWLLSGTVKDLMDFGFELDEAVYIINVLEGVK